MDKVFTKEIETSLSSFDLYWLFKDEEYSFFLDSGMDSEKLGRYSFIGFNPFIVFKSKNNDIELTMDGEQKYVAGDPFDILKELLSKYNMSYETEIPFVGGAVGYFSYDLCHYIEKLPRTAKDDVNIPDCFLGFYDGIIVIDHKLNKIYIISLGIKDTPKSIIDRIEYRIKEGEAKIFNTKKSFSHKNIKLIANMTKDEYIRSINKVRDYIESGDIYQANFTQRFECNYEESPHELYAKLRTINPAPFASFIDFGGGYIVSSSPERFVKVTDGVIETRPIKGTRPRGETEKEDKMNREELLNSEKDKAELLMIVDLERNDLGRICKTGSVKVSELFHLEKYSTVYHLVATVIGEIKEECDAIDVIKATFPGGSITGAPKIRAMEIIDELEPTQRNVYTGSIGYIGFNGDMDLNIVIRTIVCKEDKAYFQVGGGIVWDSDPELEYKESLHKAKALIKALKS